VVAERDSAIAARKLRIVVKRKIQWRQGITAKRSCRFLFMKKTFDLRPTVRFPQGSKLKVQKSEVSKLRRICHKKNI
jgi:hypothetical protein